MKAQFLRFDGAVQSDPAIDAWMKKHRGELGAIAQAWFETMRNCGDEVRELLHDGCPVACFGDAPFAYVNVFTSHVNVGFFHGAALPDPAHLLQGAGKFRRHVKLRPATPIDATSLRHRDRLFGYKSPGRKRLAPSLADPASRMLVTQALVTRPRSASAPREANPCPLPNTVVSKRTVPF
jgi:hypothetical protein